MPVFLPGTLAEPGGADPNAPSGPLLLRDAMRTGIQPERFAMPVPDRLWRRLPEQSRADHERLTRRHAQAVQELRALTAKLDAARADDQRAMAHAVANDKKAPKPKAPDLEALIETARDQEQQVGMMVVKSGTQLLRDVDDDVVQEALDEAADEARAIVASIPEIARHAVADIERAGALGAEATWMGVLLRKRRHAAWQPGSGSPPGPRLAEAAEALRRAAIAVDTELEERTRRAQGPVRHPPPKGWGPAPQEPAA